MSGAVAVLLAAPLLLGLTACGAGTATLEITPERSASDQPMHIVAKGLRPDSTVTISVSSTDAANARWSGFSRLRTDANGEVEVPMRVVDDLQPSAASLASSYSWPVGSPARFDFKVFAGGRTRASAVASRTALEQPVTMRRLTLRRQGIAGRYFAPAAPGRYPGLLLFGGSEGGLSVYGLSIARQLAGHGIAVLDVAYWSYPGLPAALERIPLEYFARGLNWLRRQKAVEPTRIDVEGISRGSEAALLLGVDYPHLVHGVVASVPSNLAGECFGGSCNGTDPAWTFHGRGITPFSPIPVEKIPGPIFAICGTRDLTWPSCPQAQAIMARRRAHHAPFADTLVAARDAGHFVGATVPYRIASNDFTYSQRDQDEAGAEKIWPRLIAFIGGNP